MTILSEKAVLSAVVFSERVSSIYVLSLQGSGQLGLIPLFGKVLNIQLSALLSGISFSDTVGVGNLTHQVGLICQITLKA